jgi:hypothetical protein
MGLRHSLAAYAALTAGYVPIFVEEIEILVVAVNGLFDEHFSITRSRLMFSANTAAPIDEVEKVLVVAFKTQLLYFFRHIARLDVGK